VVNASAGWLSLRAKRGNLNAGTRTAGFTISDLRLMIYDLLFSCVMIVQANWFCAK
jgi:hypothetical protein